MVLKDRIINKLNEDKLNNFVSFPNKNLLIEITNHCNNKCIFCYNDCMQREKKFIDKDLCEKVLIEAYSLGMREVGFYVTGEPLLDTRLSYFISFAKKIGYEYIYITTNGILADLNKVKDLYESGLNSIKYSINATNERDYLMVHGSNNFGRVVKNLSEVYEWKVRNNKKINVFVSFITLNMTNDLEAIENLFYNKCDEYVVMPAINQGGLIPDIKNISTKDENYINSMIKYPCNYPFNSIIVTVEGYVTACCMDFENMLAYADLNKVSLIEAWNNSIITEFRKKHLDTELTHTICDNCIYNVKSMPVPLDENLNNLKGEKISFKSLKKIKKERKDGSYK